MKKTKNKKLLVIAILAIIGLIFIDQKFLKNSDPDMHVCFIEKQKVDTNLKKIGIISGINTRFKTLKQDSLIYKSYIIGTKFKVITNGITYKKEGKWIYDKFSYNLIELNANTDELLKFYLDSTLVNW